MEAAQLVALLVMEAAQLVALLVKLVALLVKQPMPAS
jgi:hypothetical protein